GVNVETFTLDPALASGDFTIVVTGFSVGAGGQSYALAASENGSPATPTFMGDYVGIGVNGLV
ncbi:MAG: hypothetical protein ACYDCK_14645, partial [Thermoplasmatota archaeon]